MMSIYSRQCRYRTKSRPFFCLIFFCPTGQTGFWLRLGHYSQVRVLTGHCDRASLYHKLDEAKFTLVIIIFFLLSSRSCLTLSTLLCKWFTAQKVLFFSLRSRWGILFQGRPGQCLQNKRSSPPILCLSVCLSLQCVAREAACSSSGWLVWSRWEDGVCGAVCCGLRFTTGTIPPPASALAARCSPGRGPYPLLPIPCCLWRNASGPRTLNATPLFWGFFSFMDEDPLLLLPKPFLCAAFSVRLFLARHDICDATWPARPVISFNNLRFEF